MSVSGKLIQTVIKNRISGYVDKDIIWRKKKKQTSYMACLANVRKFCTVSKFILLISTTWLSKRFCCCLVDLFVCFCGVLLLLLLPFLKKVLL